MKQLIILTIIVSTTKLYGQYQYRLNCHIENPVLSGKMLQLQVYDDYSLNRYEKIDTQMVTGKMVYFSGSLSKPGETCYLIIETAGNQYIKKFILSEGDNEVWIRPVARNSRSYKNPLSNILTNPSTNNRLLRLLDSIDIRYAAMKRYPNFVYDRAAARLQIIEQYPDTYYALLALYRFYFTTGIQTTIGVDRVIGIYDKLAPASKESPMGVELYNRLQTLKNLGINNIAPAFTIPDATGAPFNSSQLAGKVWLLAFGTT